MKKKTKKYALGGMAMSPGRPSGGSGMGLAGIRDEASNLMGTASQVSQGAQSLVGGGGFGSNRTGGQFPTFSDETSMSPDRIATVKNALSTLNVGGYKKGGKVKSASARADGCAIRGKTRA